MPNAYILPKGENARRIEAHTTNNNVCQVLYSFQIIRKVCVWVCVCYRDMLIQTISIPAPTSARDPCQCLLGFDAMQCCKMSTFQRSMLPPLHPEDGCSMDLWNAGILPQHYTASQSEDLDLRWNVTNIKLNLNLNFSVGSYSIQTNLFI